MARRFRPPAGWRAELLARELFLDYLAWVRETHGSKTHLQRVNTVAAVLEALKADNLVAALPTPVYLRRGENSIDKVRQPRPYPADIIEQVDTRVIPDLDLNPTIRSMLRLTRWGGLRISELVGLPIDSLRDNGSGGYWVEYWMPKTKSWRRFPLPADLGHDLREQQDRVRGLYGKPAHMFPSRSRSNVNAQTTQPWSSDGFRKHVRHLFAIHDITGSAITGERVTGGEIHRYRHTVGTTLLNNNWTQPEVQEFLGHASPTMTSTYGRIVDATLNRKAEEFYRDQGLLSQRVPGPADPGVERLRSKFTVALSNGFCMLPPGKTCDFRPTPCLECSFYDPGGSEFAPVHANHRTQLRLLIAETTDPAKIALNQQMLNSVEHLVPEEESTPQ